MCAKNPERDSSMFRVQNGKCHKIVDMIALIVCWCWCLLRVRKVYRHREWSERFMKEYKYIHYDNKNCIWLKMAKINYSTYLWWKFAVHADL